jgi:hypothetical protein
LIFIVLLLLPATAEARSLEEDLMSTTARPLGIMALVLGLALAASAQPGQPTQPAAPKKKLRPAVAAVVELADKLDRVDVPPLAAKLVKEHDACDFSLVFSRWGAGIGSAVHAGHQDAIVALVKDWCGPRPPTRKELQDHRADLMRVARVMQVMAEVAPHRLEFYVSEKDTENAKEWRQRALEFGNAARDLEKAIAKTNAAATLKMALRVQDACRGCHKVVGIDGSP